MNSLNAIKPNLTGKVLSNSHFAPINMALATKKIEMTIIVNYCFVLGHNGLILGLLLYGNE